MTDQSSSGASDERGHAEPLPLEPVPAESSDASAASTPAPPSAPAAVPADAGEVSDLDVCPSCGAKLRGDATVLCLRCGFDLKTLKTVETETGVVETPAEAAAASTPIVRTYWADRVVLPVIAGLAALAMIIAMSAGHPSVYRAVEPDVALTGAQRFQYVLRFPILVVLWCVCGIGGVLIGGWLTGRPPGGVRSMVVRLLTIVVLARLVTFIDVPNAILEFGIELLGQAIVFVLLTMLLFRLRIRAAAILVGVQALLFVALYALAHLVAWTTG